MQKAYYAGMDIEAPCGRCKGETRHRVLSITNGVPEKLICDACKSVHKFREERPQPARAPRASHLQGVKLASPRPAPSSPSRWQELMIEEQAGTVARPYAVTERWEEGQWLDHPSFGLGKVQKRVGRKVDVLFKDGIKTLISA